MKTRIITTLLTAVFLVTAALPANAQSTEQLFQKGIMKEEGEGNLPEAIEIFNSIVEDSNADDALQAKALLHVGLCYEKLGKSEASRAYQKLINNFPTRKNEVAIARERLSRLILAEEINEMKSEKKELIVRKVLADAPSEPLGAPSPDGRYISFVDWGAKSNLSILDLNTNEKKCVTDFKNEGEQAYYSSWSPDGKKLAFFWWEMGENEDIYNISVVDVTENNQKKLYTSDQVNWIELGNWSSDGKYILATLSIRDHPESQIVRISTSDGSVDILKSCDISYLGGKPLFSPDNRFVAYDLPDEKASGNSDIHILSIDNKSDNPLFKHPAHDNILGWSPEGNYILFASDRKGTVDAMLIPVQEGKSIGKPILVKSNIGRIVPMGFTQKGSFYYGEWPDEQNIYSTEIDFEKGKILNQPTLAIKRFEGKNGSPAYSNDGRFLAYISARGVIRKGNPMTILCIRELATGKEYEIAPPLDQPYSISHPTWSPDDSSIALMLRNQDGNQRIYNYNLQTKSYSPLVTDPDKQLHGVDFIYPQWSLDGKTVYYFQLSPNSQTSYIKVRNIKTGKDKVIFQYSSDDFMDRIFNIKISPDGKWISAINRGKNRMIKLVATNGEETKDLDNFILPGGYTLPQFWSNDGKHIIYAFNTENGSWNLKRIPIDGGKKSEIEINILGINSPNLHPDGRQLIFSSLGFSFPENPIWEMENFLPSENEETAAKEPEGIQITQVWKEPYLDFLGSVSSDGRYLSYVHWGKGDVAIHDLQTNKNKILTHEAELGDSAHFALSPKISPDGNQIAYLWWNPYHTFDLKIIDVNNPEPKNIYRENGVEVYPMTWLSENELVTIRQNRNDEISKITLFNVSDGTYLDLKNFNKRKWTKLAVSPEKEYIAYNCEMDENANNSDINLIHVRSKKEIPLITHPANDKVIGWLPGTNKFLFVSDRTGTMDLWVVPIENGVKTGPAKRIFVNIGGVEPMGITSKGNCFIGFSNRFFSAIIAPFDSEKGEVKINEARNLLGSLFNPTWSPDGKYLACIQENINKNKPWQLTVKDLNSGEQTTLGEEFNYTVGPRWSPDGEKIMVFGYSKDYKAGLYNIDIITGKTDEVLLLSDYKPTVPDDDALPISGHEWSPDGKKIFLLFHRDWIIKHDLNSGADKILLSRPDFERGILDISPDGKYLVFATDTDNEEKSNIYIISVDGNEQQQICQTRESGIESVFWSPDGNFIYFSERPDGTNLWRVNAKGGKPEKIWHSDKRVENFDMHPSGNQIVFKIRERMTEIRKIENLKQEIEKIYAEKE